VTTPRFRRKANLVLEGNRFVRALLVLEGRSKYGTVDACTRIRDREGRVTEEFEFTPSAEVHQLAERFTKVGDVDDRVAGGEAPGL